jgi:hypothetical protein
MQYLSVKVPILFSSRKKRSTISPRGGTAK